MTENPLMNGMTRGARIVAGVAVTKSAKGVANDTERKKMMIDKYNEVGIPALEYIETANMTMTGNATAKPASECIYPCCEDCDKYHGHYCTVPIVVSKQIFRHTEERLENLQYRLTKLEELVTDEILGSKE